MKLDKLDFKLLEELDNDSRQTTSQLAKKLRTSQQVISYRLNSLEKRKIVSYYFTYVNLAKLGYTSYRVMIYLGNLTGKKYKEITNYLMKHPNVLWLVECGGKWDILVNFMARNVFEYNKCLRGFRDRFPEQIQNFDTLTILEVVQFGRDYFTKQEREIKGSPYIGKEYDTVKLDLTNLKILNEIAENARISLLEVSQKIGVSSSTIIQRIKKMKKQGIIHGFRPMIHLEKLGYNGYKALIKFHNITDKKEKEIVSFVQNDVSVVGIIKLIGAWDFEIEFEVKTKEEMLRLTRNFRDRFKEVIKEFEVIPLFHEYRYNYFPRDLLNP